ncbi:MAG: LysE family transporter [Colwellia sp.]|nr:LysE family transporter [Colwellia sp.]
MGVTMVRSSSESSVDDDTGELIELSSPIKMYFQSFLVTAGNPKAIVFFGAVFPQFIDSSMPITPQAIILVSICALCAFCCFMVYAIGGQKASFLFSTNTVGVYVKRVIGSTFIGSGLALALSSK